MATSDRLYELACECKDQEARLDRLVLELARMDRRVSRLVKAGLALADAVEAHFLDGPPLPATVQERVAELREAVRNSR